jgi:hypothetical protein
MIGEDLWTLLEQAQPEGAGLIRRRVREESSRNLFIGVTVPDRFRAVVISVEPEAASIVIEPPSTRALRTTLEPGMDPGLVDIKVVLTVPDMARVFSPFVDDVLDAVAPATSDEDAVRILLTRFSYWKNLLSGSGAEGMSKEKQQGLYGELWCLNNLLLPEVGSASVTTWTGPDRDDRDFQQGTVGIEVKTTIQDNPPVVRISNERQLDARPLPTLYLTAMTLDALPEGSGETLNGLVDQIRDQLMNTPHLPVFVDKLLSYGYSEVHRAIYERPHYTLRQLFCFQVGLGFPRVTESDLPEGVGRVTYHLSLNALDPWRVDPDEMISGFRGPE